MSTRPRGIESSRAAAGCATAARIYWWVEILAILVFYFVYSAIRNRTRPAPIHAFNNAEHIIHWQQRLGIYHEETIQDWALHFKPLIIAANYFYGSLHFVVTIAAGIYLFRKFSDDYPRYRNTLAIATLLALVGFKLFPLMPPRLLDSPAELRLRRHAREVPDVLVVQLGRGEQDLEPVRGDAERARRAGRRGARSCSRRA